MSKNPSYYEYWFHFKGQRLHKYWLGRILGYALAFLHKPFMHKEYEKYLVDFEDFQYQKKQLSEAIKEIIKRSSTDHMASSFVLMGMDNNVTDLNPPSKPINQGWIDDMLNEIEGKSGPVIF